jgi:drug/metabolite transporter (DMT)-like permease
MPESLTRRPANRPPVSGTDVGQRELLAALVVAILAVSTSAILIRVSDAPPIVAAFYRVLFTVSLLAPLTLRRHRNDLRSIGGRDWVLAVAAGIALSLHFALWFESLSWTSVAASVTLVQTQPIVVAIGAWLLLDERVTRGIAVGIAVAIAGAAVISLGDLLDGAAATGPWPAFGNALALTAAVMVGTYWLSGRSLRARLPVLPYVTVVYATCTFGLLAILLGSGAGLLGYAPHEWLLFLGMAIGPGILGHTVLNWTLGHLESSVVSVTLVGEPVGSAVLALLVLGEVPGTWTIVGAPLVLGGIVLAARGRAETERESDGSATAPAEPTPE